MPETKGVLDKKTVVSFACGVLAGFVFFALLVLALLVFFAFFYFFLPYGHPPPTYTTSSGFAKIKPQLTSARLLSTGVFDCTFTNGVGTRIHVKEIRISDSVKQASCRKQPDTGVPLGDNFKVTIDGCGRRRVGDPYTLSVEIDYDFTLSGSTSNKTERGTIRGIVE